MLAKDVPADTETEALKAQAVLVRTQISRALQRSTQAEETENQKSDRTGNVSDVILEIDYLSQKEMQDQWPADEYKKRYEKYRNAIEATENEVLFYNDTICMDTVPSVKYGNVAQCGRSARKFGVSVY